MLKDLCALGHLNYLLMFFETFIQQGEMEKKIRQRLIMQQTYQEEMAFREMRRQAEKEEEEAFGKMMMAKFAEDDRIEQMNAQKRRMKQLEHKREVEKLIENRRRQREADMVQTTLCVCLITSRTRRCWCIWYLTLSKSYGQSSINDSIPTWKENL